VLLTKVVKQHNRYEGFGKKKKRAVLIFLGRYVPMTETIFTCIDCFLCVVSGDLVFLASVFNRKLLSKLNNFGTQNGPSTHIIVATGFVDRQVGKSC
jgi:hypothetical protein